MKKILISIISIAILLTGLVGWKNIIHSQGNLPYPDPPIANKPPHCVQQVANEMSLMSSAWAQNRKDMLDQEKPASEIVDEAFESMRTYRCWLDYLCEAVLFSANADKNKLTEEDPVTGTPITNPNTGTPVLQKLTSEHINQLPGCVKPENVEIPGTELKYLDYCSVGGDDTVELATDNYTSCRKLVNRDFTELEGTTDQLGTFKAQSEAYIGLTRDLKVANGEKKNRAIQNKLASIINKMLAMESHMELLKQHLFKFDAMLPCLSPKCN